MARRLALLVLPMLLILGFVASIANASAHPIPTSVLNDTSPARAVDLATLTRSATKQEVPSNYWPDGEELLSYINSYFKANGKYIDPELYKVDEPTRVILAVKSDVPVSAIAKHMLTCRATPALGNFYLVLGLVDGKGLEGLLRTDGVVMAIKDIMLVEQLGVPMPKPSSLEELRSLIRWPGKSKTYSPEEKTPLEANPPIEPSMWWVTEIQGAQAVWNLGITGENVTIAIVDTGIDFGTFMLSYPDYIARYNETIDWPANADVDALHMAITNITVTAFENASGVFIPTAGLDPLVYFLGTVMPLSWLIGAPWPWNMSVTGIMSSGETCKFGVLSELAYPFIFLFPVIVLDADSDGTYDTVYVDLSFWLSPDFSFSNDPPITADQPIAAMDLDGDGFNDISCGSLSYFLDVWMACPNPEEAGGMLEPIDDTGNYVCLMFDFYGHGTACASCAAGKFMGHPVAGPGMAPGAKLMGVLALWIGDIIEGELWAAGFDLIPGTEGWSYVPNYGWVWGVWQYTGNHKADIISNSWGASAWALYALMERAPWYDVLTIVEDCLMVPGLLDPDYPGTLVVHAGGNGGPGYGTFVNPGYGFLPISVGASTSMAWSAALYGYAGGYYDEVIPWSARGPNPLGVVEPDVVSVGAYGLTAVPVYYSPGDGFYAYDLFGGTSMATPVTAGICALVIQAYYEAHGEKPTPETVKAIIKSSAKDLGYDPFVQGAGRVDALAAVLLANSTEGLLVTSEASWKTLKGLLSDAWSTAYNAFYWQLTPYMPETWRDVSWFAGYVRPGESTSASFTIFNPNATYETQVELSATTYEFVDAWTISGLTGPVYPADWAPYYIWGNITILDKTQIPPDADLMVVVLTVPYSYFDMDGDYWEDNELWLYVGDWNDTNADGFVNKTEVYRITWCAATGTSQQVYVGFPLKTFQFDPVVYVRQLSWTGPEQPIPFELRIEFWRRADWSWLSFNTTSLTVPAGGSAGFTATITIPEDALMGAYEGQIIVNATIGTSSYMLAIPVSVTVPLVIPSGTLSLDILAPEEQRLYDPFRVGGFFDWWWRYEAGDWKLWPIDIEDPTTILAAVFCNWTSQMTDVDMFAVNPSLAIVDGAISPYLGGGCFAWYTRTGITSEFVLLDVGLNPVVPPTTGIYTILLHNVLFDGTIYPEELNCSIRLLYLSPRGTFLEPITVYARSGATAIQEFTLATGLELDDVYMITAFFYLPNVMSVIIDMLGDISAGTTLPITATIFVPPDTPEGSYLAIMLLNGTIAGTSTPIELLTFFNVTVDNTLPTGAIIAPTSGSYIRGITDVVVSGDDVNFDRMELYIDGALLTTWTTPGRHTFALNTTMYADGDHVLTLKVFDKAGNEFEASVDVIIDNTPPEVSILSPAGGYLAGTVDVTLYGFDAYLDRVELYIDDELLTSWSASGVHTYGLDTTAYADGSYTLKAKVIDKAGNEAEASVSIVIDNTLPTAAITAPEDGAEVTGTVAITVSGDDVNFDRMELYIDGALVATWTTSGTYDYEWDTTAYGDGAHRIELRVIDKAGNSAEASITVHTTNVAAWRKEARTSGLILGAAAAGIPLLIVGAAAGFLLRRRP
ncbi:MAG: hypothetical protein DRN06_04080 [Thermoprotei archaeon]|nr:MAG: hypothetical protein DRN06_04080 [Thermoprotei archaeon]